MSNPPLPPSDSLTTPPPSSTTSSSINTRPTTDMETFKVLSLLLPKVPLAIRVAIMHILRLSAPAPYLDLRSELIVSITRSFLNPARPMPISATQKLTLRDPGPKGRIWVSTYASPAPPETGVRDALLSAVEDLRDKSRAPPEFDIPDLAAVEAEWTGYRAEAKPGDLPPSISEAEKYRAMNEECSSPATVLYLHGGAYYLCDPCTHRATTKKLAKLTGGRCYSVRYRLAPQHPFPAALLDALVSYFTLLYPPPDAYHDAVAPEHIVLAGDSAGGNLAFSLMALLLHLHEQDAPIMWHGELRPVPLPAGVCGNSPWVDISQSATTWEGSKQAPFDYLPPLNPDRWMSMPACRIWPTSPPRKHVYVADSLLTHPLVTLPMHTSWTACPPAYICTGWELLGLEGRWFARQLHNSGVKVVFEEYEAMPHVFAQILPGTPNARRCYESWAAFIRQAVEDPGGIEGRATTVRAKGLEVVEREFGDLCDVGEEEMRDRIRDYGAMEVDLDAKL